MLNLSRTATESADYSFSGIVIERDPTNHELPRGPAAGGCGSRLRHCTRGWRMTEASRY
jgi:hypothetical protein